MRAVALDFERRRLRECEIGEPRVERADEVLFRVVEVGVCGTDRDLAGFRLGFPPEGEARLVIGHEALGQVVETGRDVRGFQPGSWVVPRIRRACSGPCPSCAAGRKDLCITGSTRERGLFGIHGYFCTYAVDAVEDLTAVPPELVEVAVLAEPLSVVEKAIERALRIREMPVERALVLGAGPVGLLAALTLQIRGAKVALHSLEPRDHSRARLADSAGIEYLESVSEWEGKADVVIEATGSASAAFQAIACLGPLGVCAIVGAPLGQGNVNFSRMIVHNQVVFGSVNASPQAFETAVADLARMDARVLNGLIRRVGFSDFESSVLGIPPEAPKLVHVIE